MTRHSLSFRSAARRRLLARVARACAAATLVLAMGAHAQGANRSACVLHPPSADAPAVEADGAPLVLTAAQPIALASWDVRWWRRHRLWITLTATNQADAATILVPEAIVDAPAGVELATGSVVDAPLALAPHAVATQRFSLYVPDDAKLAGVRVRGAPGVEASVAIAVDCSDSRFDAGELPKPQAALLDEALGRYFAEYVDPLPNPRDALRLVQAQASGAQDAADVGWALRTLMHSTGDVRSFFVPAGVASSSMSAPMAAPVSVPTPAAVPVAMRPPVLELRADGSAYLRLFEIDGPTPAQSAAFAHDLHDRVAAMAARHPRAWIVDLRASVGATAWPAMAALTSLLDGPAVGGFVTRTASQPWIAERGVVRLAGEPPLLDLELAPEAPFGGPVAVLIGPGTADGGEMLAVAFQGRPRTRFFGLPTAGFPTSSVHVRTLADGSRLGILDTRDVDRNGVVHRGAMDPDERIDAHARQDAPPPQAIDWVLDEHLKATH